MHLRVTLAGYTTRWRFPGSQPMEDWLAARPWAAEGGLRTLWISSAEAVSAVGAALGWYLRAFDGGVTDASVLEVPAPKEGADLLDAISRTFEFDRALPRRQRLQLLAAVLRERTNLLVLDLSAEDAGALGRFDEADAICEVLGKLGATVTAVTLACAPGIRNCDDFRCGEPLGGPWDHPDNLVRAWRSYLHLRVAWECAGDMAVAARWDRACAWGAELERDDVLERALNERARAEFERLPRPLRDALLVHVAQPMLTAPGRTFGGLMWCPWSGAGPRWRPWVARALIPHASAAQRRALRPALSCVPLRRALVARCLDLEARVRPRWRPEGAPPTEAAEGWERFRSGRDDHVRPHYPAECPATPDDAWAFASFGAYLAGTTVPREQRSMLDALRALRNTFAHGHYVSWASVRRLQDLEARLGDV